MIKEIAALAEAMGVPFQKDMAEVNLKILSNLAPEATTSMQRDIMAGKQSEIDGLVYEVVRMGEEYHVPVPAYEKVAENSEPCSEADCEYPLDHRNNMKKGCELLASLSYSFGQ